MKKTAGFSTLELAFAIGFLALLVGALILSVNPLELARERRDSRFRQGAEELRSAIERYFAAQGKMPWVDDFASDEPAEGLAWSPARLPAVGICGDNACLKDGDLIRADQLLSKFRRNDFIREFYVGKSDEAPSPVFVCFVPTSAKERQDPKKLKLISPGSSIGVTGAPAPCPEQVSWQGSDLCYLCLPEK